MPESVDPAKVIADIYSAYAVPGRRYPSPLPPELVPWYLYIADAGHSILITLGEGIDEAVAAPVKAVLRAGWRPTAIGFIHCDLPYDPELGLLTNPDDDEYEGGTTESSPTLRRYAVGELFAPGRTRYSEGAMEWVLSESGVHLALFFASPTDNEVLAIRKGDSQFALLAGQHALILAHRFDPLPWSDAPWQASREHRVTVGLPLIGPTGHLVLTVYLVDANTGILKAIRTTTWSPQFVDALRAAITTQLRNASTVAQGAAEIDTWYRRYPTTDDLVAAADINTRE